MHVVIIYNIKNNMQLNYCIPIYLSFLFVYRITLLFRLFFQIKLIKKINNTLLKMNNPLKINYLLESYIYLML